MAIMNPKESRKMIDIEDLSILLKKLHKEEITEQEFKNALKCFKHLTKEASHLLSEVKRGVKRRLEQERIKGKSLRGGEPHNL